MNGFYDLYLCFSQHNSGLFWAYECRGGRGISNLLSPTVTPARFGRLQAMCVKHSLLGCCISLCD
jgi:hypothetical protein